ncbi:MAG TPA: hypothetical protein VF933_21670 [Streptosporangiaceae bacterium]
MSDVAAVDRLTRRFETERGVTEISFTVRAGEVSGLPGPQRRGQAGTIRLLLGLYRPASGSMRVLGADPTRRRRRDPPDVHQAARSNRSPGAASV